MNEKKERNRKIIISSLFSEISMKQHIPSKYFKIRLRAHCSAVIERKGRYQLKPFRETFFAPLDGIIKCQDPLKLRIEKLRSRKFRSAIKVPRKWEMARERKFKTVRRARYAQGHIQ